MSSEAWRSEVWGEEVWDENDELVQATDLDELTRFVNQDCARWPVEPAHGLLARCAAPILTTPWIETARQTTRR